MQSFKLLLKKSLTEYECYSATFHAERLDYNRYLGGLVEMHELEELDD